MKKIHLSIPKPCREDWEGMTPNEKGRFCSSCQKTVVDFTNMNDRQIAEFFKRPSSSVCGRIYNDQLERDITIPKKRIPWFKYFFQFTWPAFVLFLKSCGGKETVAGKVHVESKTLQAREVAIVGMMLPEITPADTTKVVEESLITSGEIAIDAVMGDTIVQQIDSAEMQADTAKMVADTGIAYKPMDTVVVVAYPPTHCRVAMGAVSVVRTVTSYASPDQRVPDSPDFKVYPNPVRAGSGLTVSFEGGNDLLKQIQVLSSSGQLVLSIRVNEKQEGTLSSLQIPSNISAGVYFLQITTKNKKVKVAKLLIEK
jgi:hypothetical protein